MKICPKCKGNVADGLNVCTHCGAVITPQAAKPKKKDSTEVKRDNQAIAITSVIITLVGIFIMFEVKQKARQRAECLADDRGDGGAVDTPFQRSHEDQIQRHIGDGGDDEVAQGTAAVAYRLQNAHAGVVDDHKEAAHEVQSEILDGLGQHVLRRPHPHQDLGGQEDARRRRWPSAKRRRPWRRPDRYAPPPPADHSTWRRNSG